MQQVVDELMSRANKAQKSTYSDPNCFSVTSFHYVHIILCRYFLRAALH